MGKPLRDIVIVSVEELEASVKALFDTGSFYSIVRDDRLPRGAAILRYKTPRTMRAASKGSVLTTEGEITLVLRIGDKQVNDVALVSSSLSQEMIVGAGTMQKWDISIVSTNGHTDVVVGHDMRDPDITEVD
ncbi:MAG: hypothetical protein U0166_09985 [Acidobacteriota bacterium]